MVLRHLIAVWIALLAADSNAFEVRCTVIMQTRPDRLYCYATNQPFRLFLKEPAAFTHGEVLIARGSEIVTNLSEVVPTLLEADVERTGLTNLPPPLELKASELKNPALNFHRVAVRGRVVAHEWMNFMTRHIEIVIVEDESGPFRVNVLNYANVRERWPVNTEVEIVGLNFIQVFAQTRGFEAQVDVRNLDECRIVRPASWLTLEVAKRLMFAGGALVMIGGIWFVRERRQIGRLREAERTLEQRIQERTAELSEEVAARKNAEAGLRVALDAERELGQLKSRFVSMISHEFRTPLSIIMSSAEILDAYLERLSPEERRSNVTDIVESSKHMASMIDEVLLLSRVEAGKMTFRPAPVSLDAACARFVDEVVSATGGRCPIKFHADSLPTAQADEALLRHIFTNLLMNAVKYSPEKSPVDFTVEARNGSAVFTVVDRGIGINDADTRQLFQPFFRGSNVGEVAGTGLGLVVVKRCVELHHGTITFASREGAGTTFTVTLPLAAQPQDSVLLSTIA